MEAHTDAEAAELRNGAASHGHKRTEEGHEIGGEVKRPREGKDNKDGGGDHLEYMDEDDEDWGEEINVLDAYCEEWEHIHGKKGGSFEDETEIPAMLHTVGPMLPSSAWPRDMLQIFSVKVMEIMGSLSWPLQVYGHVAVRDVLDHKRNYLFRRERENCQTLNSPQDSSLRLTGPSRAVVLINPVIFEVDLKVKSNGTPFESEDKILSYNCFCYSNVSHIADNGFARREDPQISRPASPLASKDPQISTPFVLLDSLDKKVAVADDGLVTLDRRVDSVDEKEERKGVHATEGGDGGASVVKKVNFRTRLALRSQSFFELGFCKLSVTVAWSMIS
ncbi:unnamed protein product [Urochloa decumbens]|uniref:DUF6598 domain-containing protein n=1 Tax=Urochloa decumbens TaxID=240449 RepID=A0ABC9GQL7_9POAL